MNSGDQTTTAVPTDAQINTPPASDKALLPTHSNDQLLDVLRLVARTRQTHKNVFILLIVASLLYFLFVIWMPGDPNLWILLFLLAGFVCEALVVSWRRRKYALALGALSQRSETRAVGILLSQEDYRPNSAGASTQMTAPRQLLLELLPHLKPERFRRLNDAQINKLCDMAFFPNAELSAAAQDALARCGEDRALRALQQPGRLALQSSLQEEQKTRFATSLNAIVARVEECAQAEGRPAQESH